MTTSPRVALLIVRLTLSVFLIIWVIEKFLKPETTSAIWGAFYLVENFPHAGSYAIGGLQAIALLGFVLGYKKLWSYGFWMVAHTLGTIMTWQKLIDPYTGGNHLFLAAIPVAGAFIALFLLRHEDSLLAIET